jgi:hypothetical protein
MNRVHYLRQVVPLSGLAYLISLGCSATPEQSNADPAPSVTGAPSTPVGVGNPPPNSNPGAPTPGSSTSPTGTSPTGTSEPPKTPTCNGDEVTDSKRVVRLSFNQLSRTLHVLLGDDLGREIDAQFEIGQDAAVARTFPPLSSPQEGSSITTGLWQKVELIAKHASEYVERNAGTVTGCGDAPSDACAREFVGSFAERAYRRPLTSEEQQSVLKVYSEVYEIFDDTTQALKYSVSAILQSPQFLYRTEFGSASDQAGPLTPYELASALSYFLTDGPPDAELLAAAARNELATPAQVGAQADRILKTPEARTNLTGALFSYFQLDSLASVKIDDPGFTAGTPERPYLGVRESAYKELELFLEHTLWNEPLSALLTSNKSFINQTLAPLYGVDPATLNAKDESEFVEVTLPDNRAGILTRVGFLASNSRPDVPSVVARGLVVNKTLLCQTNPPFPEAPELTKLIEEAGHALATASERERAEYRTTTPPCLGCHVVFDAYGLALDTYDIIGRHRTEDPEGRPIDPSVTLPPLFNNEIAEDAIEMQERISENPGFDACFTRNMLNWALAEGSQLMPTSCATTSIVERYIATNESLSSLLREIAVSRSFSHRNSGVVE